MREFGEDLGPRLMGGTTAGSNTHTERDGKWV